MGKSRSELSRRRAPRRLFLLVFWLLAVLAGAADRARAQELIPGEVLQERYDLRLAPPLTQTAATDWPRAQELIPGEALQERYDRRLTPPPTQIGPLAITPTVGVDEIFNDNIFATPTNRTADLISNLGASSKIDYAAGNNTAEILTRVLDHIYAVNTTETEWEGSVSGIYRHQAHDDLEINMGGGAQRLILPRSDPTGLNGLSPTTFWVYDAFGGAVYGDKLSNLLSLRLGASQTSFDALQGTAGLINTSQRDFHEIYALANFDHALNFDRALFDRQKLFVELRPNVRHYDQEFDGNGFQRSSNGGQATFGAAFDLHSAVFVRLSTGFQLQSYDDPRFGTVREPDGNVKISWWPTELTSLNLDFSHAYEEGFFNTSPGAVRNLTVLRLDHELRRDLIASVSGTVDDLSVVGSSDSVRRKIGNARLQYQFSHGFAVTVDYAYIHQTASGTLTPFDQQLFTVGLKKLF